MRRWLPFDLSRRGFLGAGLLAAGGAAITAKNAVGQTGHEGHVMPAAPASKATQGAAHDHMNAHGAMITVGEVDDAQNGFDPTAMLTDWETGEVSTLPDGRTLRTFQVTAEDKEIEIAPGVMFPAWTYNGRVPGPALRATEGDRLRIVFKNNGSHPHSMHFHGIHAARMDGVPGAGADRPGRRVRLRIRRQARSAAISIIATRCRWRGTSTRACTALFVIDPDPAQHPEQADVARSRLLGTPENARVAGNGDGDERLRHEFRRRERVLCLQHHRPLLCQAADQGRDARGRCASIWSTSPSSTRSTRSTCTPISSTITTRARR